ncbi:UNVERIFIED_CONTAM: hypothetical protein FKN15_046753 [Acipenser sinensis]
MVTILTKTLEKKGADDVTRRASYSELHNPKKMSKGTTLFSCGIMECDSWAELSRKCPFRKETASASLESLWARSNTFPGTAFSLGYDQPCFGQRLVCQPWPGFQALPSSTGCGPVRDSTELHRSLSLSHEQISALEYQAPSAQSSPDSTPKLGRRVGPGGLSRSRSQPCVLNDKKIGMKRRRPEEAQEQRPSLDLAKMTQKLRNFHSLSCPGIPSEDCSQTNQVPPTCRGTNQYEADLRPAGGPEAGPQQNTEEDGANKEDLSNEELHSPDKDRDSKKTAENVGECVKWEVESRTAGDASQLGGELDIDQIERN